MRILITGGTGFLGQELTRQLLRFPFYKIRIFSRSESKQSLMREKMNNGRVEYVLGDIRNLEEVRKACKDCDIVIHAAAIKTIAATEENIFNAVDININGVMNLIKGCNEAGVKTVCFISTDKASRPHTAYGATKYMGEQLFRKSENRFKSIVVRYGNVIGSTMSVFEFWDTLRNEGKPIPVRSTEMTRFFWTVRQAAEFIIDKISEGDDSKLHIPEIQALNILKLAKFLYPDSQITLEAPSHNEKIHEEMFPGHESSQFVVEPEKHKGLLEWIESK